MTTLTADADRRAGPLRHRDFRLFWIGQSTSRFGSAITAVALPLVAIGVLRASTFQIALLEAAVWSPWLLIGLPAGVWVERLPRRAVLIACDLTALLMFASVPAAAWLHALTVGQLLAVALLTGVTTVFFETAYQVYLPSLLSADHLAAGNAELQASGAAAQVLGPGAGGVIAQLFGAATGLLADAVSFLVSTGCLLTMRHREPPRPPAGAPRPLRREIVAGLRFLTRDPYLRVMTVHGAASNFALTGYQAVLVVFLVRGNGISPGTVGVVIAAMSSGGVIGALTATRIAARFGTSHGMLLCQLAAAPFALLIPLASPGPGLIPVVIGGMAVGTGVVASNVIKSSFRQTYTPRHLLGRVVTGMQLVNYGTIPLGALTGGGLGSTLGLRTTVWTMTGALVLSTGILLTGPLRTHRDFPPGPPAG